MGVKPSTVDGQTPWNILFSLSFSRPQLQWFGDEACLLWKMFSREKERHGLEAWGKIVMGAWWISFALPSAYPLCTWPVLLPGPRMPTTLLPFSEQSGEALPHGGDGWVREEQADRTDFSLAFHTGFLLLRFLWLGPTETSHAFPLPCVCRIFSVPARPVLFPLQQSSCFQTSLVNCFWRPREHIIGVLHHDSTYLSKSIFKK